MWHQVVLVFLIGASAQALDSADNKFMKDYAMLKIYESCFGTALLKQITKELKDAYTKCSIPPPMKEPMNSHVPPLFLSKMPPGFAVDPNTQTITKPLDGAIRNKDEDGPIQDQGQQPQKQPLGGVLSFRPHAASFQPQAAIPPYMIPAQFRPYNANPFYPNPYAASPSFYPPNIPYNPYMIPQQYQQGFYQQQQPYYAASNRMSRHLGLRARLGLNSARAQPSHNVTCVMQELGYIDSSMEPNYEQIAQRISNLPVSNELKSDIQDGLQFCQKFSQCVPEENRDILPRSQEQIRSIFFFRCYKHKKLEACIMKDINEHFNKEYMFDSDNDFALSRQARSVRDVPLRDPSIEALQEMEVYLYDYLSGGGGFDFDLYI